MVSVAFAILASTSVVAIGSGVANSGASSNGGANTTLTHTAAATKNVSALTWWIWYRPLASLDPVKYNDYPEDLVIPNLCEPLVKEVPGQTTVPNLATSWSQPNPLTVIMNIRRGVKFWDGTPMTSADVVYSLQRNFVAANASIYDVKSITATGPYTVKVTMKAPNLTFIPELGSLGGSVVEKAFTIRAAANFGTPQGKVMCTGPFKLKSWNASSSLVMVRNDSYWNKSLMPKTKQITFVWPQDPGQVATAFQSGTFAGGFDILPSDIVTLAKASSGKLYIGPQSQAMEIQAMIVIGTKGAIANQDVRQALSLSINRQQLIKAVFNGIGAPAYTYIGGGYYSYQRAAYQAAYEKIAASYNNAPSALKRAKALVTKAGSVAKLPIVLAVQGSSPDAANEASVVQQSAAAIGLTVKLKIVSDAQYGALFSDPKARIGFDLLQTTNYDQDPDPMALLNDIALPGAISNFDSYNDPAVVKLLNTANGTADLAKRAVLVIAAQTKVMQFMPWIPMVFIPPTAFVRQGICGVTLDFSQMMGPWAASVGGC
jgi:peptide/nickel transport system substrate-binding protein